MKFTKGDRVYVDPAFAGIRDEVLGRVFVVRKVNPKNVLCDAEDGGKGINYPAESLRPYEGEIPAAAAVLGRPYVPVEFFDAGSIVTLTAPWRDWTTETPLVVLADKVNKVNVTRLGGDGDHYLRAPREGLTRRTVEWLAEDDTITDAEVQALVARHGAWELQAAAARVIAEDRVPLAVCAQIVRDFGSES